MSCVEVRQYRSVDGHTPFGTWLASLRDPRARARIVARIDRLVAGLKGDWRSVGRGVIELRVDCGPGYRIYVGQSGQALVILLCGGDKRTQVRDIEAAHEYWTDYQKRSRERAVPWE